MTTENTNANSRNYNLALLYRERLLSAVGCAIHYTNQGAEYSMEAIIKVSEPAFDLVDITKLSKQELLNLGFSPFYKHSSLLLMPIWLLSFVDKETELTCINTTKCKISDPKFNTDTRFGLLAYGVMSN